MSVEQKLLLVTIIALFILCIIISYIVGYERGFKKCKKIDDDIIDTISSKLGGK